MQDNIQDDMQDNIQDNIQSWAWSCPKLFHWAVSLWTPHCGVAKESAKIINDAVISSPTLKRIPNVDKDLERELPKLFQTFLNSSKKINILFINYLAEFFYSKETVDS